MMKKMQEKEITAIKKEIRKALKTFSDKNRITEERKFRKKFHTKFFKQLQNDWNLNNEIKTKIQVKYGLIHNSIHAEFSNKRCEIGDFLFVVKDNAPCRRSNASSVLLQVKCSENADNNTQQKTLYSNWPEFTIARPRNPLFLNDRSESTSLTVIKQSTQSVYFEYSKICLSASFPNIISP